MARNFLWYIDFMRRIAKGHSTSTAGFESPTRAANRIHRTVAARLAPSFWMQLKQLGIDHNRSIKNLLREALNDLFVKYGQIPIASSDEATVRTTAKRVEPDSSKFRVQISLTISKQLDNMLEKLAYENDTNKNEVLRKAFALFEVANGAKDQGHKLGVLSKDRQVLAEIIGL